MALSDRATRQCWRGFFLPRSAGQPMAIAPWRQLAGALLKSQPLYSRWGCLCFKHAPINTSADQYEDMIIAANPLPLLLVLLVVAVWQPVHGETIYKSVDSEGQVTYSSTPPPASAHAEKLKVAPPPSEEEIRQARELAQRVEEQGRELEKKRVEQEAAQKAEEERLRAMQPPPPPIVIEKPVYVPRTIYYPPVIQRPPARPPRPPIKPKPAPEPR